jgi:hypothetical protein
MPGVGCKTAYDRQKGEGVVRRKNKKIKEE